MFCKEGFSLLADRWASQSGQEKMESTDCEYDSEGEGPQLVSDYHCQESRRILYLASQHLKGVIIDTPALCGWPPTANDIRDSAQQLIPPQLFNFLAWITGSADVVECGIGILNGLGHSVSHSAVLEHDTALANKKLCTDNIVPEGFIKNIPTTVIWDNNDFREETPSGDGTTYNTNGFLVQRIGCVDDGTESIPCINSEYKHLPKKKRSVDPPPNVLEMYHKRKRQGPIPTSYKKTVFRHSLLFVKTPRVRWTYYSWLDRVQHASKFHYYSSTVKTGVPSSDKCQPNKNGHCLHHFNAKCCYCR